MSDISICYCVFYVIYFLMCDSVHFCAQTMKTEAIFKKNLTIAFTSSARWPQTQQFSCIILPRADTTGVCHHIQPYKSHFTFQRTTTKISLVNFPMNLSYIHFGRQAPGYWRSYLILLPLYSPSFSSPDTNLSFSTNLCFPTIFPLLNYYLCFRFLIYEKVTLFNFLCLLTSLNLMT